MFVLKMLLFPIKSKLKKNLSEMFDGFHDTTTIESLDIEQKNESLIWLYQISQNTA